MTSKLIKCHHAKAGSSNFGYLGENFFKDFKMFEARILWSSPNVTELSLNFELFWESQAVWRNLPNFQKVPCINKTWTLNREWPILSSHFSYQLKRPNLELILTQETNSNPKKLSKKPSFTALIFPFLEYCQKYLHGLC